MKLSIFTTVTRPDQRGDNYKDALACYTSLADETVIIYGRKSDIDHPLSYPKGEGKTVHVPTLVDTWPKEFSWEIIGEHFQRGYEAATGDWVIHADLDFIFHEKDFATIRAAMEAHADAPALSFYKHQFILPDRYNLKSRLVIMVNKAKFGDRIRFDSGGDLCQPSLDGQELKPDDVPEIKVPFFNYEKLTKTEPQIRSDAERMERAYYRHFDRQLYSTDKRGAYDGLIEMMVGRFNKPQKEIPLSDHPKFVQETIANLRPDQWGFNGFGLLPYNNYQKGKIDA